MIKILLDQNIPAIIEFWLQEKLANSAIVTSTRAFGMNRLRDTEIFFFCQQNEMIVIAYNEDFQNPLVIPNVPCFGVIRLNFYPTGVKQTQDALGRLLAVYPVELW